MEITDSIRANILSPPFILSILVFLLFIIEQIKWLCSTNRKNLPPSPSKLPIIGNLHQVGDKPHVSFANLARKYGPLMSLRLGMQDVVVASSPEAAVGILKTQDHLLSARTVPTAFQQEALLPHSFLWSDCNDAWKNMRTLCRTEIFFAKAFEARSRLREEKLDHLLEFLHGKQGQAINIEEIVFITLFNTLSCIMFDKDLLDLEGGYGVGDGLKESIRKILEYGGRIKDFGSFFPMLQRFDLQGIRKGGLKHTLKAFSFWEDIIKERRAQINSSTWSTAQEKSFLDRLLENEFSNNQINELTAELLSAGTNTTTTAVVWAVAELLKNKDVMAKIQEEMKREINSDKIKESHLSKLPYLQACVKEALRLHPPVPFLLPRKAIETCEVMSYIIPKNARIFVNVWAIGRDPKVWDDPLSFKPERFLDSNLDFKGQHFELLPFGSGRRICPGLPSGSKSIEFILASLIHEFDWALPNGEDPSKLEMDDKFLITLKKDKPLEIIFKSKIAS